CCDQSGEPVKTRYDVVTDFPRWNLTRPADDARYAEAALKGRSFASGKGRLTTIGPSKVLRAVVSGEDNDGVVVNTHVLHLLHDGADDVVKLRHTGFLDGPAILRRAHLLVFVREMSDDVHAGWVEPKEERFTVVLRLLDEFHRVAENFVVNRLHALRTEFSCVFDLLLADLSPTWLNRGVIHVRRPTMDHVAGSYRLSCCGRIVGMARVLHRVQMIEIAEELIEAMHGRQELVEVT